MRQRDSHFKLSYSVRRYFVDQFFFHHVPMLPAHSRVLDLGGNKIRKRGKFDVEQYDLRVFYANLSPVKQPDVESDAARIPFADDCFDVIICAELLEHVSDPEAVLHEGYRVLRPGGIMLITVPFLHPIHGDPYDFGRYTDHYWRSTLLRIGFRDPDISRQGLFFSVWVGFFKLYINKTWRRPFRSLLHWPIAISQQWAFHLERKPRVYTHPFLRSFTTGFGIRAVKD